MAHTKPRPWHPDIYAHNPRNRRAGRHEEARSRHKQNKRLSCGHDRLNGRADRNTTGHQGMRNGEREAAREIERREERDRQYIQSWLDQTESRNNPSPEAEGSRETSKAHDITRLRTWDPHNLPARDGRSKGGFREVLTLGRAPVTNASILSPHDARARGLDHDDGLRDGRLRERGEKRIRSPSGSLQSLSSFLPEIRYEKRPRRKTREDRYDAQPRNRTNHHDKNRENRAAGERNKRKKPRLSSVKDVADRFVSEAVLNERLTVRKKPQKLMNRVRDSEQPSANPDKQTQPALKPGLFHNGRTVGALGARPGMTPRGRTSSVDALTDNSDRPTVH